MAALSAHVTVPAPLIVAEKGCVPPPVTLGFFGEIVSEVAGGGVGGGVTAAGLMVMIAESVTVVPSTIAISATSVLAVTLEGGVYVTLVPVELESVPMGGTSCHFTVPAPLMEATNASTAPPALSEAFLGLKLSVVAVGRLPLGLIVILNLLLVPMLFLPMALTVTSTGLPAGASMAALTVSTLEDGEPPITTMLGASEYFTPSGTFDTLISMLPA